jgi:branched-chain amino acid transport system substrate-binding protein
MAQEDSCGKVAMINDNSSYGEALANNLLAQNRGRVSFAFSESVGPRGRYRHLVDRVVRMTVKPDCVVYCGTRNPNTVAIFKAFADALPTAKLYGTDGLVRTSFFDFRRGGVPRRVAGAVKVMVPPYDVEQAERLFFGPFREAYNREADPNAVYAYEAMRVALKAIADSASGERRDILRKLLETRRLREESVLGEYSMTQPTGDTDVTHYGVSTIEDGRLTPPDRTPRLLRK